MEDFTKHDIYEAIGKFKKEMAEVLKPFIDALNENTKAINNFMSVVNHNYVIEESKPHQLTIDDFVDEMASEVTKEQEENPIVEVKAEEVIPVDKNLEWCEEIIKFLNDAEFRQVDISNLFLPHTCRIHKDRNVYRLSIQCFKERKTKSFDTFSEAVNYRDYIYSKIKLMTNKHISYINNIPEYAKVKTHKGVNTIFVKKLHELDEIYKKEHSIEE